MYTKRMTTDYDTIEGGISNKTKKTIAIVAVVLIVVVAVLLVYAAVVYPSKQPYRNALAQYDNVGRANATLTAAGSSLNASNATDQEFEKNVKNAQNALTALRKENEALGKEAVLKDGEGKRLYDAFNEKLQPYMDYNETVLTSMLKVRPVLHNCNQDMANLTEDQASIDAVRSCATQLRALENVGDPDYKQLVQSFSTTYDDLAAALERKAPAAERTQILGDLSAESTTFTKNTQQHRRALLATDSSQNLKDFLSQKANVF